MNQYIRPESALTVFRSLAREAERTHKLAAPAGPEGPARSFATRFMRRFANIPHVAAQRNVEGLLRQFHHSLLNVQEDLDGNLQGVVIPELQETIRFSNRVEVEVDPLMLAWLMRKGLGEGAGPVHIKRARDAHIKLTLGVVYTMLDLADPPLWIGRDIGRIDDLSMERVYEDTYRLLYVTAWRDPELNYRVGGLQVHTDLQSAEARRDALRLGGWRHTYLRPLECRVARVDGRTFYVETNIRSKSQLARAVKLFRKAEAPGEHLKDNRGWREIVVAVEQNGDIRLATREDAEFWVVHTRRVFWGQDPMHIEEMDEVVDPYKDPAFFDIKTLGRIVAEHDGLVLGGRCEQQVTTVEDDAVAYSLVTPVNQGWRRARQIYDHVLPFVAPSVDWGDKDLRAEHERLWRGSLIPT